MPEVFGYQPKSDPGNKTNVTYILMERLSGHILPTLEQNDIEEEPGPKDLVLAKKVHEQLTDIILQLTSLKFDKIGSLREDSNGSFYIAPYVDPIMTAYPKYKAARFQPHEAEGKIAVSLGVDTASRPTTVLSRTSTTSQFEFWFLNIIPAFYSLYLFFHLFLKRYLL